MYAARVAALLGCGVFFGCGPAGGWPDDTEWTGGEAATRYGATTPAWHTDYHFALPRFQPRPAPPPESANGWAWPTLTSFRARFDRHPEDAVAFRLVELRAASDSIVCPPSARDDAGRCMQQRRFVGLRDGYGETRIRSVDIPGLCRGSCHPTDNIYEVLSGDIFRQGEAELVENESWMVQGHVIRDSPALRIPPELWKDWVYTRTLLAETREPVPLADDSQPLRWERSAEGPYDAAVAVDDPEECFAQGDVVCYLTLRAQVLEDWARQMTSCRALGGSPPCPELPPPVPATTLARSPLDLERFFTGLLLRADARPPYPASSLLHQPLLVVVLLIIDTGRSQPMAWRLTRLAADAQLDTYNRASAAQALLQLLLADPALRDEPRAPLNMSWYAPRSRLLLPDFSRLQHEPLHLLEAGSSDLLDVPLSRWRNVLDESTTAWWLRPDGEALADAESSLRWLVETALE
jgi:hypothetical protein